MHHLLFYDYCADYLSRRAAYRSQHLKLAWEAQARGELVLGGAIDDPLDGALLVFKCESPAIVEAFVAEDPYVRHGLVERWRVRTWHTVVGSDACNPIMPDQAS
jgi:uncharacterized protein